MKSLTALEAYIEQEVNQNGNAGISGVKLQQVLKEIAQNGRAERILADPTLTAGDIGKAMGLNPDNGRAGVYQEEPAVTGTPTVFTVSVNDLTPNPAGQAGKVVFTMAAQPSDGDTFTVNEGGINVVFTFKITAMGGTDVQIGVNTDNTVNNLYLKIMDNTSNLSGSASGSVLTLEDDKGNYENVNNVWYIINNGADPVYFDGGASATVRTISLYDASTSQTHVISAADWNDYENAPASKQAEAQNIASHITASTIGFTGNWVKSTDTLTITSDNNPVLESTNTITLSNLDGLGVVITDAGGPDMPKHSQRVFLGFLGGLEDEGGTLYAVMRSGKMQVATLVGNNPIDLNNYDITTLLNGGGVPSGFLVATDGGKLRTFNNPLDTMGTVGMAVTTAANQEEEQVVTVRELFIPIFRG